MKTNSIPWYIFWPFWLLFCFSVLSVISDLFTGHLPVLGILIAGALGWVLHPRGLNYWGRYVND